MDFKKLKGKKREQKEIFKMELPQYHRQGYERNYFLLLL